MTNFKIVPKPDLIPEFLEVCPEFAPRWNKHCDYWLPNRAGDYNDLAELAHFVIDSYDQGHLDIVKRILSLTERLLAKRAPQITQLLIVGLLEDIQIIATHCSFGTEAFVPYLGPISLRAWCEIAKTWEGKSSLMDVLRAELDKNGT
jgi:hypothetical protein